MDISLLQGSNLLKTPAVSKLLSRANGKEPTIQANLTTQTTASSLDENIQCKSSLGGAYSICKFGLSFLPSHTKPFFLFWLSRTALPVIYKVRGRGRKVVTFADRSTHNFLCEYFEKDPLERLESEFFSSHNQLSPPHSNSPSNQAYRQIDSILLCKDLQEKAPNYLKSQLSTAMRIYKLRLHRNIILPPEVRSTSNVKWEGGSNRQQPGQDTQIFWVRRLLFCRFTCKSDSWACKSCRNSPNKPIAGR